MKLIDVKNGIMLWLEEFGIPATVEFPNYDNYIDISAVAKSGDDTIRLSFTDGPDGLKFDSWSIIMSELGNEPIVLSIHSVCSIVEAYYSYEAKSRTTDFGLTVTITDDAVIRNMNCEGRFNLRYKSWIKKKPFLSHWKYILIGLFRTEITTNSRWFTVATLGKDTFEPNGYICGYRWTIQSGIFSIRYVSTFATEIKLDRHPKVVGRYILDSRAYGFYQITGDGNPVLVIEPAYNIMVRSADKKLHTLTVNIATDEDGEYLVLRETRGNTVYNTLYEYPLIDGAVGYFIDGVYNAVNGLFIQEFAQDSLITNPPVFSHTKNRYTTIKTKLAEARKL